MIDSIPSPPIASPAAGATPDAVAPPIAVDTRRISVASIVLSLLFVILAWGALELWGLGMTPLHTKGEPREGLVVWQMTHGGGWILPSRDSARGPEVPSKPPLFHWLGALTSELHGAADEGAIRFPSALLSLLSLLCVFAAGAALWGVRAGLFSALALMSTFEWARAATSARVDMTLTFGLLVAFLSLLFFLRTRSVRWLIPLYVGISLAVLGKGPIGALLPGLLALAMFALMRDIMPLRHMRLGVGALTVGLIAGSWYVLALLVGGAAFFRKQILAENLFTFINHPGLGSGGHRHAVPYLFLMLLLGLMPWTLLLPGVAVHLWRRRSTITARDPQVFLLAWIGIVLGFFSLAASKRGVYLLALYPAAALLLGWWADEQTRAAADTDRWLARAMEVVSALVAAAATLLLVAVLLEALAVPLLSGIAPWLSHSAQRDLPAISDMIRSGRWPLLGYLLAAVAAFYASMRAARAVNWTALFAAVFIATAAITLSINQVILPGIAQYQTMRNFMTDARQMVGPGDDLFFYRTFDYGAAFYWHGHIRNYDGPWPEGAPRYLLMQKAQWEQAPSAAREQYELVSFPHDTRRGKQAGLVLLRRIGAE